MERVDAKKADFEKAAGVIEGETKQTDTEKRTISIATKGGIKELRLVLQRLEDKRIEVESVSLHRLTLDDVFLNLTGHTTTKENKNV